MKNLLFLTILIPTLLMAQESKIMVQGSASVSAAPDQVQVNFAVQTKETTAKASQEKNARVSAQVVQVLKNEFKIDSKHIQTTSFQVGPRYRYHNNERTLEGFDVTNQMSVTLKPIERTGPLLDALTKAGVTNIHHIQFLLEAPEKKQREALAIAFEHGRAKAESLAKAAGRKLGRVVEVQEFTESITPMPRPEMRGAMSAMASAPATSIEAGELSIQGKVVIWFELKD